MQIFVSVLVYIHWEIPVAESDSSKVSGLKPVIL